MIYNPNNPNEPEPNPLDNIDLPEGLVKPKFKLPPYKGPIVPLSEYDGDIEMPDVNMSYQTYPHMVSQYGLATNLEAHALLSYAIVAEKQLTSENWEYENESRNQRGKWAKLADATAFRYGVSPTAMLKMWPNIDRVMRKMNLAPIPKRHPARLTEIPNITIVDDNNDTPDTPDATDDSGDTNANS